MTWKQHLFIPMIVMLVFGSVFCYVNANAQYILDRTCQEEYSKPCHKLSDTDRRSANAKAESMTSTIAAVPNAISLVTAVYLSVQGDIYGRRPVLLFNIASLTVAMACNLGIVFWSLPVWSFIPVAFLSGIGGNMGAFLATVFASVADVSNREDRTACFSRLEGTVFLAGAVGSSLGGVLVAQESYWAYLGSVVLLVVAWGCVYAYYDDVCGEAEAAAGVSRAGVSQAGESEAGEREQQPGWKESVMLSVRLACDTTTSPESNVGCSPGFICMMFAVVYTAIIGAFTVFVNFVRLPMFGFSETQAGLAVSALYMYKWFYLLVIPVAIARWVSPTMKEVTAIRLGAVMGSIGFLGYVFSTNHTTLLLANAVESMDVIAFPALRSLLSQSVGRSAQGAVLSMIANIETAVQLLCPLAIGQLYTRTLGFYAPFTFCVVDGIMILFMGLTLLIGTKPHRGLQGEAGDGRHSHKPLLQP
jgi:MFS transporter, DHA1 family, tetracycline resistance protein